MKNLFVLFLSFFPLHINSQMIVDTLMLNGEPIKRGMVRYLFETRTRWDTAATNRLESALTGRNRTEWEGKKKWLLPTWGKGQLEKYSTDTITIYFNDTIARIENTRDFVRGYDAEVFVFQRIKDSVSRAAAYKGHNGEIVLGPPKKYDLVHRSYYYQTRLDTTERINIIAFPCFALEVISKFSPYHYLEYEDVPPDTSKVYVTNKINLPAHIVCGWEGWVTPYCLMKREILSSYMGFTTLMTWQVIEVESEDVSDKVRFPDWIKDKLKYLIYR